ncbi:class I SAM-dependent methyltransferase [Bailinhaonella thermotolerans]|uniref:class I SAM-dependent methyltransferase n=1 Tax=Bailinhaonella thermotolerans TaxID=1070861 RepID=UPI001F5B8396|nr:class I SAM-dependent methyltransferase [Bailinhaonella thermotolerans]
MAVKGVDASGLDLSAVHLERARRRWGHLPGARFVQADAAGYLADTAQRWEAIYSIWGAVWFSDPARLLPLVRARLAPGGRFVFSHAPAVPGCYGPQGMYGSGFRSRPVWVRRWAYEPHVWADVLAGHDFTEIEAWIEPAPDPALLGTLIVTARAD